MDSLVGPPGATAVPRVAPKARLHWDEVRERHVLLYPEGLVTLNETAAAILQLCDGEHAVEHIVATLKRRYQADGIERDVAALLQGLAAKGLVSWC
jgi:pyrroloquinoline quinone biosynthesis protein D